MADLPHIKYSLLDRSYQGLIRSELKKMAEMAGFQGHRLGETEIVIAEITSNLVKHASKGGDILARIISNPSRGIEFIAIDNGPGMQKPLKMMEDGLSTTNTLGQGLGAIRRLSNEFDLYSIPGWGTILYSRIFIDKDFLPPSESVEFSSIGVCKKGELVCGDQWVADIRDKKISMAMIDGLGHGLAANLAAREAVSIFRAASSPSPVTQLRGLHEGLKKTRGAVVTVAQIDETNHQLKYSGVGNITMKLVSSTQAHGCLSYNGIVGHIMPAVLNDHFLRIDKKTDIIVMHSDGLSARWDLQKYMGIMQHRGIIICAALYKDFDRKNDDSTILVVKFVK